MKRLIVTIGGMAASPYAIRELSRAASRELSRAASREWASQHKEKRSPAKNRKHRALTPEEREEKRLRTERAAILRKANRLAREHDMFMRRPKRLADREVREAERAQRRSINVRYKPGREPNFVAVCPRSLFRRTYRDAEGSGGRSARVAGDGLRNVVLKHASCRGFGKKASGTRPYVADEAGRLARYICRLEGIEEVEGAVMTNVMGTDTIQSRSFSVDQMQKIAGFLNALEEIERATGESHVCQHLILALPVELGPEGRARALARFCQEFGGRNLPFAAALHKPDPGGDQRNYHAHIVLCARPFEFVDDYEWSFEAEKFTELTSKPCRSYLRSAVADAMNAELQANNSPIRYSGIPEAERLGTNDKEEAKGQKETAKERAEANDTVAALALISDLASCLVELKEKAARKKRSELELGKAQREQVEPVVVDKVASTRRFPIYLDDLLGRPIEKAGRKLAEERTEVPVNVPAKPVVKAYEPVMSPSAAISAPPVQAPVPTRAEIVHQSMSIFKNSNVPPEVRAIAKALKEEPQSIALAMYEGRVQIAFKDRSLDGAVKSVAENPLMELWLERLSSNLSFDHAAVPRTWGKVSVFPFHQTWIVTAEHWAITHGSVPAQPLDASQSLGRDPYRSAGL